MREEKVKDKKFTILHVCMKKKESGVFSRLLYWNDIGVYKKPSDIPAGV